jgi:hypothetical protein
MKLYEIHVSVNLKNGQDEIKWLYFCNENNYKSIRVLNDTGSNNIQNMISKWCNRKNDDEAIYYADQITYNIQKAGFEVIRTKVEAMMLHLDYDKISLDDQKNIYWEIHYKVVVKDYAELLKLIKWKEINNFPNIGLSISSYGNTRYPIITIRMHSGSRDNILQYKNIIIDSMKNNGFHITDKIQQEISIYDTFPEEDNGWISKL